MPPKKSPPKPVNPELKRWGTSIEDIKKDLDKRKGEKNSKGLQGARECVCKGVKIILAFINDESLLLDWRKKWNDWTEEFSEHRHMIDESAWARSMFFLLQALVSLTKEDVDTSALRSVGTESQSPSQAIQRIMRVIRLISDWSPDCHFAAIAVKDDDGTSSQSPYLSTEWFDFLMTILEYAESEGIELVEITDSIVFLFETLMSFDNCESDQTWGSDVDLNKSRLGNLVMSSKVTSMCLHGLRTLIFSLSTTCAGVTNQDDIKELRRQQLYAAISTHPLWNQTTKEIRERFRLSLEKLPIKVSMHPRLYMHLTNLLYKIQGNDKPQGYPLRSFFLGVRDMVKIDYVKMKDDPEGEDERFRMHERASRRLSRGEVIAYVDQLGVNVIVFDQDGIEEAVLAAHDRAFGIFRHEEPGQEGTFEWTFLGHGGMQDQKLVIDIEGEYADRFESALKRWLGPTVWLESAHRVGVIVDEPNELVPASSAAKPTAPSKKQKNAAKPLGEPVDLSSIPTHASDSFGPLSLLAAEPHNKPATKSTRSKASQAKEDEEKVEGEEAIADYMEPAIELDRHGQPRMRGGGPEPPSPKSYPTQSLPRKLSQALSKVAAEDDAAAAISAAQRQIDTPSKSLPLPSAKQPAKKKGKAPARSSESDVVVDDGEFEIHPEISSSSSGRPTRAAKSRSIRKTAGMIRGEAVPLVKAVQESAGVVLERNPSTEKRADRAEEEPDSVDEEFVKQVKGKGKGKTPAKGKGKAAEKMSSASTEEIGEEVVVKGKEDANDGEDEEEQEAEVDGEGAMAGMEGSAPIKRTATPPAPTTSSQHVPVKRADALSRSRQKYSRDRSTSKQVSHDIAETSSDADVGNGLDIESEDPLALDVNDDGLDMLHTPSDNHRQPLSSKSANTRSSKSVPIAASNTKKASTLAAIKPKPATRAKVSLVQAAKQVKETIAAEIKAGQAMTPEKVQAKLAASAGKRNGNVKNVKAAEKEEVVEKIKRPRGRPRKLPLTAPARIETEDVEAADMPSGDGMEKHAALPVETEEATSPVKVGQISMRSTRSGASQPRTSVKDQSDRVDDAVEGDVSHEDIDNIGVNVEQVSVVPIPSLPLSVSAHPKANSKTTRSAPPARPAVTKPISHPSPKPLLSAIPTTSASALKSAMRKPSPDQLSLNSLKDESEADANVPSDSVHLADQRIETEPRQRSVAFSDPVEPHQADPAAVLSEFLEAEEVIPPVDKAAEEDESVPAEEKDETPISSPNPDRKPAGVKRKSEPDKEGVDETGNPPSKKRRVNSVPEVHPEKDVTAKVAAPASKKAAVPVQLDTRKRKVSIEVPEPEKPLVKRMRKAESIVTSRKTEKGKENAQAVDGVMEVIDDISEVVKRRIQERLAIPDKIVSAIDRHIIKIAKKSINSFGVDHTINLQSLQPQILQIQTRQTELQASNKSNTELSKKLQREVRDTFFKKYQNPMEGIPLTLF